MHSVLNNKLLLFIVAVLLLANIAMLIFFVGMKDASHKNHRNDRSKSPISVFLEKEVGFNQEQMASYEALRQQNRQKMKPLFEDIRVAKIQFYQLLRHSAFDTSLLNRAALTIGEKQKNIDLQAFQNFRAIRSLCSPEQQLKYDLLVPGVIEKMWFSERKGNSRQKEDSLKNKNS
ncbi:MAG: hypothetical protein WKF97_10125 [Chitinophagaceae bacterium]